MSGVPVSPSNKPRQRARGSTKVRTGCTTCRIRRIKCDEAKPSCMLCARTGRRCDGPSYSFQLVEPDLVSQRLLQSKVLRDKKEQRTFEYFRHHAVSELMGFDHGSDFWNKMVLQLTQTSPAVMHAILGLGALYKLLNTIGSDDIDNRSLFLREYNKSIRHLRSYNDIPQLPVTLTCCIIFICIEMAQGNYEAALTHLENGLQILHNWNSSENQYTPERENITQLFRRLDVQATVFLNSRQPIINATSSGFKDDTSFPESFSTLQDARNSLEGLQIRLLYTLTAKSLKPNGLHSPTQLVNMKQQLLEGLALQFSQWKSLFDEYSNRESKDFRTKELQMAVLLSLYYQTSIVMLDMRRVESDPERENSNAWSGSNRVVLSHLDMQSRFRKINELAESLLKSTSVPDGFRLSADMGVIPPLYLSAMDSTTPETSQQAIELLRQVKWKEGFWDAGTAATIAESVLRVKASGMPWIRMTGGIPELAEVHC